MNKLILKPRQCLTNASLRYDYGWQKTLVENIAVVVKDSKPLRLCENEDDYHFNCQLMRYSSGMNFTIETQQRLDAEIEAGYIALTENPTPIFRLFASTPEAYKWESSRVNQFMSAIESFRFGQYGILEETTMPIAVKALSGGLEWLIRVKGKDNLATITEVFTQFGIPLKADGPQPE
jgi:hypothetical protein